MKATKSLGTKCAGCSSGATKRACLLLFIPLVACFAGLSGDAPILNRYTLDVRLDPALHRISATARIEIAANSHSKTLTFLLNRQLTVTSVRESGQPVSFSHGAPNQEAKPLLVELAQPLASRGDREVLIEYHGTIPPPGAQDPDWMGALVIRSNEVRMTEQTKWYPMMDGQRARFEASIDLPEDFALVWPGRSWRTIDEGGRTTWKVVCTNPVAPALIAGLYATVHQQPIGVYLFPESAEEAEAVLQETREILAILESGFGPRPFDQLSICQMRVLNSRFSYNFAAPGVVVLPTEIIRMARRPDRKEFWTRKLAHEMAHQWWGCSVDLPRDRWPIHESLAELSAVLYLQSLQPDKSLFHFLAEEAKELRRFSSLARRGEVPNERDYRKCLAYQKGPWVLAMLREMMGDEEFDQALRSFYSQYAFRPATLDDFKKSFGAGTVMPLHAFFSQWIDRPVLPRVTAEPLASKESSKAIVLRLDQAEPAYVLPVELRLTTAAGSTITSCLLTQARQQLETQIKGPLLHLEVDPGGRLLLESQCDTNALIKILLQARTDYERLLAAHVANKSDALDASARTLCDTFRQFSLALEVEQLRERLTGQQPLNVRTELRLEEYEQLKLAIQSFFGKAGTTADFRGLLRDIAESADEIHDGVRDKQPDSIPPHLMKLTQTWEQFSHHVRTCSQIGY